MEKREPEELINFLYDISIQKQFGIIDIGDNAINVEDININETVIESSSTSPTSSTVKFKDISDNAADIILEKRNNPSTEYKVLEQSLRTEYKVLESTP